MSPGSSFCESISNTSSRVFAFIGSTGLALLGIGTGVLGLFLLHQFTLWASLDPVTAFHNSRRAISVLAAVHDTFVAVYNAGTEVVLELVPLWNGMVQSITQPVVYAAVDILSVAFAKRPYDGIISDEEIPYHGYDCTSGPNAAAWCGDADYYASQLGIQSAAYPSFSGNELTLSTSRARLLSEQVAEPIVGSLNLDMLVDALQGLLGTTIIITSVVADVAVYAVHAVLVEVFALLFDTLLALLKGLTSTLVMLVRSGMFQDVVRFGIDLLVALVVEIGIPALLVVINTVRCVLDFLSVDGWGEQLGCINAHCFREGAEVPMDLFLTFSSIPSIVDAVQSVVSALVNRRTGVRYANSTSGEFSDSLPTLFFEAMRSRRSEQCGACWNCKVPEMRAVFLLVASVWGCALDGAAFPARVQDACLTNGSGYESMCGPRGKTSAMTEREWRERYTTHRSFDAAHVQFFAQKFRALSEEEGGAGSAGFRARQLADAWYKRDVLLGQDQAAGFYRQICVAMRSLSGDDTGPGHVHYKTDSYPELVQHFVYDACKTDLYEVCVPPSGRWAIDLAYEARACAFSKPACLLNRETCLGTCDGTSTGSLLQDFATTFSKQQLDPVVIGPELVRAGRANCTPETTVIEVPLFFAESDAFDLFAARLEVRGGFLAINPSACRQYPSACAIIQRVMEREPTLTFDAQTGRFRHVYALVPPSPPPFPSPPPRLIRYQIPSPRPLPPPPLPPPPYYSEAEQCIPLISPAVADLGGTLEQDEERVVCLYVRAITDMRVEASRCFAPVAPSPPPPPPQTRAMGAAASLKQRRVDARLGRGAGGVQSPESDEALYTAMHAAEMDRVDGTLHRLAAFNPAIRDLLHAADDRLGASSGRRLFERVEGAGSRDFSKSLRHVGDLSATRTRLNGLTLAQCGAVCAALRNETDAPSNCKAVAYRMESPGTSTNTATCHLLSSLGVCGPEDFAAAIFRRRDTLGCNSPTERDNPLCIALSPSGFEGGHVLDHGSAQAACRGGRGSPRLPRPRSVLEAFGMVAQARERGVQTFWAQKPRPSSESKNTHWSGLDGKPFHYPGNHDSRCIVVRTQSGNRHGYMFAEMAACSARLADGVVCESASAAPPPPPGEGGGALPPPAPPPPPIAASVGLREFIRSDVRPRTESLCSAGLLGVSRTSVCAEFVNMLSSSTTLPLVGGGVPLCMEVCWHSCAGSSATDHDSFEACRGAECADSSCDAFLLLEWCAPSSKKRGCPFS